MDYKGEWKINSNPTMLMRRSNLHPNAFWHVGGGEVKAGKANGFKPYWSHLKTYENRVHRTEYGMSHATLEEAMAWTRGKDKEAKE
jgi:hypothetical protein